MSEELGLQYKKEKHVTNAERDLQEQNAKIRKQNPKMQATQTKKTLKILPTSTVLTLPEKCGFSTECKLRSHE
jgi:hypothetical protein